MNRYTFIIFTVILTVIFFSSCKKEKSLDIEGVWQEQGYWTDSPKYPNYDTINHTVRLLHLECSEAFTMELTHYHHIKPGDPALSDTAFKEFVQGIYSANDGHLVLNGFYYTDNTFSTKSDSLNTKYSYGNFTLESDYKIDSKRLMLGLDYPNRTDLNTFSQIERFECY